MLSLFDFFLNESKPASNKMRKRGADLVRYRTRAKLGSFHPGREDLFEF